MLCYAMPVATTCKFFYFTSTEMVFYSSVFTCARYEREDRTKWSDPGPCRAGRRVGGASREFSSPRHCTAWRSFQGTQRDGLWAPCAWSVATRPRESLHAFSYSYTRLLFVLRYIKRRRARRIRNAGRKTPRFF